MFPTDDHGYKRIRFGTASLEYIEEPVSLGDPPVENPVNTDDPSVENPVNTDDPPPSILAHRRTTPYSHSPNHFHGRPTEPPDPVAQNQQRLQDQLSQLTQVVNTTATNPVPVPGTPRISVARESEKSSVAKPEPFTGKLSDVRHFLSFFKKWAYKQKDIDDEKKSIATALSYLQGEAAEWVVRFTEQIAEAQKTNSIVEFLWEGRWDNFEEEFKTRFGSMDEEGEAQKKIKKLVQGKQSVAQYAQVFQDLGARTGFSDTDLMERFINGLKENIRMHMVSITLGQGKPKKLAEAVKRACTIDIELCT
ncbi:hypothetical protein D9758_014977 [Tetrapyrgos nigripes]|uniref:Retrotransposon gag domain-containing protein n=1 Tax=Tetrapyrgos nigripes TaxID=182062 RepID=A0A8H5CF95_9AGAR|nr:hypothetical protein D9758_014977 [Tetrapyrgos nigripes]